MVLPIPAPCYRQVCPADPCQPGKLAQKLISLHLGGASILLRIHSRLVAIHLVFVVMQRSSWVQGSVQGYDNSECAWLAYKPTSEAV